MLTKILGLYGCLFQWCLAVHFTSLPGSAAEYFGIRVVDEQTGQGVPLVELKTVNEIRFYTDSSGWIAFCEPELMDREVFFQITSPGYEYPADGFGNRGLKLRPQAGQTATIRLSRTQIAERLCRITGEGIFRDSELLGFRPAGKRIASNALSLGQDSVQAVPYRGAIFWLWGDTNFANYPLGNFRTTAATSPLPRIDANGTPQFALTYFVEPNVYAEASPSQAADATRIAGMLFDDQPGAVWLWGLMNLKDDRGEDSLLAHYSRHLSLADVAEHGLARFNDASGRFEKVKPLALSESWRFPRGNAARVTADGDEYFYFAEPYFTTRVQADWKSVTDPLAYEALAFDARQQAYVWQSQNPPVTAEEERKLIAQSQLPPERALFQIHEAANGTLIEIHRASICHNRFLNKWILIGTQNGMSTVSKSDSPLGEIWLSTASDPLGPWTNAVRIATHAGYTFYNPRQHPFMEDGLGRFVFFEGTFTRMFSEQPFAVPRYDYNQILYRVDLGDPRLQLLKPEQSKSSGSIDGG